MGADESHAESLSSARWHRLESLFDEALRQPPDGRSHWLDRECADDPRLRQELDRLLAADSSAASQLDAVVQGAVSAWHDTDLSGRQIGPYRVVREIGRGGMGVVYLGIRDDDVFHKQVAIKVVKRGMDTDLVLRRFRHERRILATLEHPFIARVLDGGSTDDGLPYLVMEYVAGQPITEHCWGRRLELDARLRLFRKVCDAVQHAHRNMVLHRDLKPSNILVDESGEPRLLDFGVAKLLDRQEDFTPLTSATVVPVTPGYASPEQMRGQPVTAAADVYALGAVLYEMLAAEPAHPGVRGPAVEARQIGAEDNVLAPSGAALGTPAGAVPAADLVGDLDTITLKALRADPRERYLSVEQLSEDVDRYLSNLPVRARPQTWRYRVVKSLRRHRGSVAATSLVIVSLLAGVVVSTMQAARAQRRFEDVRHLAQAFLFDIDERLAGVPGTTGVREAIVRTSVAYLDALARESTNDPSLLFELASGYQKIGDVQGFPLVPNLGQRAAAIDSHQKALTIASGLEQNAKVRRLLVRGHDRLGTMLQAQQERAAEHFRQALAVARNMDPEDPENAPLLVDLHGHLGELESRTGNLTAAMEQWRRTLEISESAARRQPGDATLAALSVAHWRLSRALQWSGDVDGAARHGRESVAINEDIAARHPRDVTHRRRLLNSYEQAGYAAFDRAVASAEDPRAAIALHTKALSIAESLATEDPRDVRAITDLTIVQRNICDASSEYDPAAAERTCRAGLMTLARRSGGAEEHRATLLAYLAVALNRRGRRAEALQAMEKALQLQESLADTEPSMSELRELVLRMHNHLGDILLGTRDFERARDQHRLAIAIGEVMLASRPSDLVVRRDLADTYEALARVGVRRAENQRLGRGARIAQWREARSWYQKSLEVWNEWPKWGISSAFDSRRKAGVLKSIAKCDAALSGR